METIKEEADALYERVREVSTSDEIFEQLQVLVLQLKTRNAVDDASYDVIRPEDLSQEIFGEDIDAYLSVPLMEQISNSSPRSKVLLMSAEVALGALATYLGHEYESWMVGANTAVFGQIPIAAGTDWYIKRRLNSLPVPPHAEEYYRMLENFVALGRELKSIPSNGSRKGTSRASVISLQMVELIEDMEEHIRKYSGTKG